jgi:hypothetical protein
MDRGWSQQSQRAVVVLLVVPVKEGPDPCPGIFKGTKAIGKVGAVLQGLELRLGIWIVMLDAWERMGLDHAQVCQQQGQRLGLHRAATIGMKGQLARLDLLLPEGFANQTFGKVGRLTICQ